MSAPMTSQSQISDMQGGAPSLTSTVKASIIASFMRARVFPEPYRHWMLDDVLPGEVSDELRGLPFEPPNLDGVSGKRELHNDQRHYFDAANNARFAQCQAVADAFQSREVIGAIQHCTGLDVTGTYVRLEYAQDVEGFWLEPHTDLGVKKFTMLIYLSDGPDQGDLGTDIYSDPSTWAKRSAFDDNSALIFVPDHNSWHGLQRRSIHGVRKTVIMNYVTDDWRARDQLAYPTTPVRF